jgi:hypothetical protein
MTFIPTSVRDSTWIAEQALFRLLKASVDNPPAAEDLALALDRLDSVYQNLQGRGVVYVADLDQTPAGIAEELAWALAAGLKASFGDMTPEGQDAIPPSAVTNANLRRISSADPSYGPQKVSFV